MLNRSRPTSIPHLPHRPQLEVLEDRALPSVSALISVPVPLPVAPAVVQTLNPVNSSLWSAPSATSGDVPSIVQAVQALVEDVESTVQTTKSDNAQSTALTGTAAVSNSTTQPAATTDSPAEATSTAAEIANDIATKTKEMTTKAVTQQAKADASTAIATSSTSTVAAKSSLVYSAESTSPMQVESSMPDASVSPAVEVIADGDVSSSNQQMAIATTAAKTETSVNAAQNDRAALADAWGTIAGQNGNSANSYLPLMPARDSDFMAGRLFDAFGLRAGARASFSGQVDATEDAAVFARLESLNDVGFSVSDDASLGAATAMSQLTGRRADVLPQQGSAVASVATLLGDDTTAEARSSGAADERLNHLLINPMAAGSSAATETASLPADGSGEASDKPASVPTLMSSLLLLPLGWGLVQVRRLRKRKSEIR